MKLVEKCENSGDIFVYIKEETRFWCEIRCCLGVFVERCSGFSDVCGMMLLTRIDL